MFPFVSILPSALNQMLRNFGNFAMNGNIGVFIGKIGIFIGKLEFQFLRLKNEALTKYLQTC